MEQLTLSSTPSGAFIRGNQAVLLQNNQNLNLSTCLNGDIIQQALSGINTQIPFLSDVTEKRIFGQNGFILDKDELEGDKVVELPISDDFPLHLLNSSRAEDNIFNTDQPNILLDDVLNSANDKSDNSLDSLNSLLQLSPDNGSSDIQDFSLPSVKGNFTYAYPLSNGTIISQVPQNPPVSVPVNPVNGFTNNTPLLTSASVDVSKPVADSQNSPKYVLLRGVNIKPRLVLNINKNGQELMKNNIQKVQVLPVNGKVVVNKNPRNIAPQRMALPPLKKPRLKEPLNPIHLVKASRNQEPNPKTTGTSVLLSSLKSNQSEEQGTSTNRNDVNSPVQVISNNSRIEAPDKLLSTSVMLQPNVTNIQNFLTTVSSDSHPQNSVANDNGLKLKGKVLLNKVVPPPKVAKASDSHSEPGRCTEDQLKKLQTAFQNGELKLNRTNNSSVIYDEEAKIVCKLLYPEEFIKTNDEEKKSKKRKSRPPAEKPPPKEVIPQVAKKVAKKVKKKVKKSKIPRTRSGRLSRPPCMFKDFKKLNINHSDISSTDSEIDENIENKTEPLPLQPDFPYPWKPSPKYRCPACGKNYPGAKMLLHLTKYPDHDPNDSFIMNYKTNTKKRFAYKRFAYNSFKKLFAKGKQMMRQVDPAPLKEFLTLCSDEEFKGAVKERISRLMSPWDYLVERQPAGEGAVKGLISDLSDIFKALPTDMLVKVEPSHPDAIHISDEKLCQVLNLSPGSYLGNDSVIKPAKKVEEPVPVSSNDVSLLMNSLAHGSADRVFSKNNKLMPESSNMSMNESLPTSDDIEINDILPITDVMPMDEVLPMSEVSGNGILEQTEDLPPSGRLSSVSVDDNLFGKDDNSLDLDKKVSSDLSDILLDKSSLDTVDEILNDRLNELMPLDVVTSLSESQLDRSIFSTSSLDLHAVSGSTEDLLKSLENLAPHLPSVSESAVFDFSVLSSDFGTDR